MPVQIGAKTHSFSDPTALLSDCHRRIEMFLGSLQQIAPLIERPLEQDAHTALDTSLRYFREAAPKHTADEENSLFPRLRQVENADVKSALAILDALESDHRRADSLHAEVDALGSKALQHGPLSPGEAARFRDAVAELGSIYKDHIRIEDDTVFPVADRTLAPTDKSAIALEMAARRNVARQPI